VISASRPTQRPQVPQNNTRILTSNDPVLSKPSSEELIIIPGYTKRLLIELKGESEVVSFDFRSNDTDTSLFQILVSINAQLDTTPYYAEFEEVESLKVNIDQQTKRCLITGDKGFSLTSPLEEGDYQIYVVQEKNNGSAQEEVKLVETQEKADNSSLLVISSTVGGCVVVILGIKIALVAKKRRRALVEDLTSLSKSIVDLPKKKDNSSNYNSHVFMAPTRREEINQELHSRFNDDVQSLNDSPHFKEDYEAAKENEKRKSPNSQASTAATFNLLSPPSILKPISSHMKFMEDIQELTIKPSPNISNLEDKTPNAESLGNIENIEICRPPSYPQLSPSKRPLNKVKTIKEIMTKPFKEDKPDEISLSLDMSSGEDVGGSHRKNPTVSAIRALVKKMEEEGTLGGDCDPSAESDDDEDQYEAPHLPNYFCCMLCFQGKRCTITNPCRHIFACVSCAEELMDSYKICVLCANKITGYEQL